MNEETVTTIDLHPNLHRLVGPVCAFLTNLLFQISMYGSNPGAFVAESILKTGGKLRTVIMPEPGIVLPRGVSEALLGHDIRDFQGGNDPGDMGTAQLVVVNGTDHSAITAVHRYYENCDSGVADLTTRSGTLPDGTLHTIVSGLHHTCDVLEPEPVVTFTTQPGDTLQLDLIQVSEDELNLLGIPHIVVDNVWGGLPEVVGHIVVGSAKLQASAALLSVALGLIGAGISRFHYELKNKEQGNLSA